MPSLKTFRLRIRSVQSTQKITKAMKMVAAAKLRRAQEQATAARPYAEAMDKILASLGASFKGTGPRLLAGTGSDQVHLLIVATGGRAGRTQRAPAQRPAPPPAPEAATTPPTAAPPSMGGAVYEFEPDEADILADLLPRNLTVQIFRVLLENAASFFGSQMTAMDNAARNAGDVIKKLTLQMNRSRQASITKELIEIISGAEAI